MADVTFGVKVSEEMKQELADLMKNMQCTGKEFMELLLNSYQLEQTKKEINNGNEDLDELQKLLARIQHIYIGRIEKEKLWQLEQVSDFKKRGEAYEEAQLIWLEEKDGLENLCSEKDQALQEQLTYLKKMEQQLTDIEVAKNKLEKKYADLKEQLKKEERLYEKYEAEICHYKEIITSQERLKVEYEEKCSENQRLQTHNDEIQSEIWFLKREIEKLENEKRVEKTELERIESEKEKNYQLALNNALLEQQLQYTERIDQLKEHNYQLQQEYMHKLQQYFMSEKDKL